jgi:LmbE family N-acetylglucosaminyl deacetylase
MPVSNTFPSQQNTECCKALLNAKKALFIGAHPDDIEWYCGGLVYILRQKGAEVIFAIGTRGGKGRLGRLRRHLEARRCRHQEKSAEILGGARTLFFDYPDKQLPQYVESFTQDLKELVAKEQPDIIFSWDPEFIYNPHSDHKAAAQCANKASEASPDTCHYFYGTLKPDLWVG